LALWPRKNTKDSQVANKKTMAILGCGNMGKALGPGMAQVEGLEFITFSPTGTRARELAELIQGRFISQVSELPPCDFYLVACKPFQFPELARELKGVLAEGSIVISVMAGLTCEKISALLSHDRILRCMPNTPVSVGAGATGLYYSNSISEEERAYLASLFESNSKVFSFNQEEEIDIFTAFAGSGPGFIFEMANLLESHLSSYQIEGLNVRELIAQTFWGSSKLMLESTSTPFEELRNQVTSKGGTTEAGLKVMKENNLGQILRETTLQAIAKAKEISRGKEE
jgi:pyrroline-5-carboxylate reductase